MKRDEDGGYTVYPMDHETPRRLIVDLKRWTKRSPRGGRRIEKQVEARLEKIHARYPQIGDFYDLELQDGAAGRHLLLAEKGLFCTYTRELTVDLPDLDKHDFIGAGRRGVLRELRPPDGPEEGPVRHVLRLHRVSRLQDDQADRRNAEEARQPLDEKCPTCGSGMVLKIRPFRRVHRLQQLSGVQVREAEDDRGEVSGVLRRVR